MSAEKQFQIQLGLSEDMAVYYANHVAVTGTQNEVILTFSRVEIIPVSEDEPVVRAPIQAQVYLPLTIIEGLQDALAEQSERRRRPDGEGD